MSFDHPNSQIVFGADGRAYINGAVPTNSSVVGPDNGWALTTPTLQDFPGMDIELSGIGYQTLIPFPPLDPAGGTPAAKITEPYMAFGGGTVPARTVVKAPTPTKPIQGIIAGGGTVYSFDPDAANPALTMRLEAWGFRNPYGIGIDPFNPTKLFVSNNGSDVRETTINGQLVVRRAVWAWWEWRKIEPASTEDLAIPAANPLQLTTALIFAVLFLAISLMTAWVESIFGQAGILTLAALVGAGDIDPFVLNLAQGGAPDMDITALAGAVLIAASANNLAKAVYAIGFGGLAAAGRPAIALTVLALLGFAAAVAYLA